MCTTPKCNLQFPLAAMILYNTYVAENDQSVRGWLCISIYQVEIKKAMDLLNRYKRKKD